MNKNFKIKNYRGNLLESVKKFSSKRPYHKIVEAKEADGVLKIKTEKLVSEAYRSYNFSGDDVDIASYIPSRGPFGGLRKEEEIWLWEIDPKDPELEEVRVFVGHSPEIVQHYYDNEKVPGYIYFIECPSRKAEIEKDGYSPEKRDKVKGAKSLPDAKKRTIISAIEDKFGVTLDDKKYMASKGKELVFIKVKDKGKANPEPVYKFKDWEAVSDLAYYKD